MRGCFGIGVEGASKPVNMGNLIRSGHAFGAGFAFTVNADRKARGARSGTSKTPGNIPWHDWDGLEDMRLPKHRRPVGVELAADAMEPPGFTHPRRAAYVPGPERGTLSAPCLNAAAMLRAFRRGSA